MTSTQAEETTGRRSALYTPEAVQVDLPLADVGSRALAILIDLFVMFTLLYFVLLLAVGALGVASAGFDEGPGWVVVVVILLLNFLVLWGYPTGCEATLNGRTAGKAALGLRVVTTEGAPVRFRHAAIRGLFAFVDFYLFLGIPALVSALLTRRGQRLGDLAAGTVTIRDRATDSAADQAVFWQIPGPLQAYASSLDVRGLTAADYAVVRRFLLRSGSLQPQHRARIATELANVLADRMHHRPPPGTHPEALLLCTAALLQGSGNAAPARASWAPPSHPPARPPHPVHPPVPHAPPSPHGPFAPPT
ncbi:RDD family protein [Pseudomonas sp.]|uniref:RDD family protein n=1 Tax=Pseudomonas sp. TaxID=306 RepID=UPI002B603146|nr:RDD family protein [Pseudomonas sp.]HUE90473.1 RDD family protein [Pseudomonas sp.]